jgi:hypothetical protein
MTSGEDREGKVISAWGDRQHLKRTCRKNTWEIPWMMLNKKRYRVFLRFYAPFLLSWRPPYTAVKPLTLQLIIRQMHIQRMNQAMRPVIHLTGEAIIWTFYIAL